MPEREVIQPKYIILSLSVFFSLLVIGGGIFFIKHERKRIRTEKYNELRAISNLKADLIDQWYNERAAEVKYFAGNREFVRSVKMLAENNNKKSIAYIDETFRGFVINHDYHNIFIAGPGNTLIYSLDTSYNRIDTGALMSMAHMEEAEIEFQFDFYHYSNHDTLLYRFISTIRSEDSVPSGYLFFDVDPADYLFPLIQLWPTPSKTAETLVVRPDGDSILFLNELRHISGTALKMKLSITDSDLPAALAVLGKTGYYEGTDYRNRKVICDLQPMQETGWYLITKIDTKEIYTELSRMAVLIMVLTLLIVLLFVFSLAWIYNFRQKNILQKLLQRERDLHKSQEEFRATLYSIGEGVITADQSGNVMAMNPVAAKLTGWNEDAARGKHLNEILYLIDEEAGIRVDNLVDVIIREGSADGLAVKTRLISKEKKETHVAYSGAPIRNTHGQIDGVVFVIIDQTKEQAGVKKLVESEERFRLLFENSNEAILISSPEGDIFSANPAACILFGRTEEELCSLGRKSIVDLTDLRLKKALERRRMEGSFKGELSFVKKDGTIFPGEMSSAIFIDSGGKTRASMIIRDISEQKKAEVVIRESEEYARTIMNNLPIGIAVNSIDPVISFSYMNDNFAAIYRTSREQLSEPDTFWNAVYKDHEFRETIRKRVLDDCASGDPKRMQWEDIPVVREGSAIFYISARNTPIPDKKLMISTVWDVTGRKLAENALRESEERLRLSLKAANQGLWDLDLVTGEAVVNDEYASMLGYDPTSFRESNMAWRDRLHPDDHPVSVKAYVDYVSGITDEYKVEFRQKTYDGKWKWILSMGKIVSRDKEGKPLRMLGTHTDINERKLAEEEVRILNEELELRVKKRTRELEEVNRELETFTYSVSHDLKAPLRGIDGYSKLLFDIYKGDLKEEAQTFITTIRSSTMQMNQLIDDLLEYSRLERSRMITESIPIKKMVESIVNQCRRDMDIGEFEFKFDIPNKTILADSKGISIALRNIIENAIKFTREGPKPTIEIGLTEDTEAWKLFVKDNGIGFDMKYKQRIFEIFQRLQRAEDYPGTGIGLAMVSKAMQRMKGKVWAESEPGTGSTFFLELPKV